MSEFIAWDESFAVGIAGIDHDHWHLLQSLGVCYAQYRDSPATYAAADFLSDVHAHLAAHFALEEKYMRRSGQPDLVPHQAAHAALLDAVSDRMEDHYDNDQPFDDAAFTAFLRAWLIEHFRTSDAHLVAGSEVP